MKARAGVGWILLVHNPVVKLFGVFELRLFAIGQTHDAVKSKNICRWIFHKFGKTAFVVQGNIVDQHGHRATGTAGERKRVLPKSRNQFVTVRRVGDNIAEFWRAGCFEKINTARAKTALNEVGTDNAVACLCKTREMWPSPQAGSQIEPEKRTAFSKASVAEKGVA